MRSGFIFKPKPHLIYDPGVDSGNLTTKNFGVSIMGFPNFIENNKKLAFEFFRSNSQPFHFMNDLKILNRVPE